MDEPTSSLTAAESEHLFAIVAPAARRGARHRLHLAPDGRGARSWPIASPCFATAATSATCSATPRRTNAIVAHDGRAGAERSLLSGPARPAPDDERGVRGQGRRWCPARRTPVSFSARRGEILGFAGLVGAGRTELMQTIFGVTPALGGEMTLERRAVRAAQRPATRSTPACFSCPKTASGTASCCRCPWPRTRRCRTSSDSRAGACSTARPSAGSPRRRWRACARRRRRVLHKVVGLSGGNQQKVVLGKWLAHEPARPDPRRADTRHRRRPRKPRSTGRLPRSPTAASPSSWSAPSWKK